MKASTVSIMAGFLGLLAIGPAARAGPVTWGYTGIIREFHDSNALLGPGIDVGTPISGEFTFESDTPDARPDTPVLGNFDGGLRSMLVEIASLRFYAAPPSTSSIVIFDAFAEGGGIDQFIVLGGLDVFGASSGFGIVLSDHTGRALSGDQLPPSPPDLALFDSKQFAFGWQANGIDVLGDIISLFVVPEPTTVALLLSAGCFALRSRRKRPRVRPRQYRSTVLATCALGGLSLPLGLSGSRAAAEPVCGCMDLVLLVDVSTSTLPIRNWIVDDLKRIVQETASSVSAGDLRVGLITFGDSVTVRHVLTYQVNTVLGLLDTLRGLLESGLGNAELSNTTAL